MNREVPWRFPCRLKEVERSIPVKHAVDYEKCVVAASWVNTKHPKKSKEWLVVNPSQQLD